MGPYIDRCVHFHIMSIPLNLPQVSRSDPSLCVIVCFSWSGRELGGHSMFCVSRLVFCVRPSMVLNQRQVSLVVSD